MFKQLNTYKQVFIKYSLALVLLAIPLYPKFPLLSVPGTYVAIRLEDILIGTIIACFLLLQLHQTRRFLASGVVISTMVYLAVGFLSILSAILVTHTVTPHIGVFHFLRRVEYMGLMLLAASSINKESDITFFLEILFWVVTTVVLYGLGQRFLNFPVISTQNMEFSKGVILYLTPGARLNSTFAGHYDLAAFSVLVIPLFIGLFSSPVRKWLKFIGWAGFFAGFWLLLASASRISFPAYIISGALTLYFVGKRWWVVPFLIFSLIFASSSSELTARYSRTANVYLSQTLKLLKIPFLEDISSRIAKLRNKPVEPPYRLSQPTPIPPTTAPIAISTTTTVSLPTPAPTRAPKKKLRKIQIEYTPPVIIEERSTEIRLNAEWPRAIRSFKKNPLLGTGFSSITLATDNDYLRMLGETGIIGTLAFSLIFISLAFTVVPVINRPASTARNMGIAIAGSAIGILVNATFIDIFEASKVAPIFWVLTGFLIALVRLVKNEVKPLKK